MIIDKLIDKVMPGLEKAMDLTFRRNEAISSNIANAETPLYRASDLNFGKELDSAFSLQNEELLKTNSNHMDISSSQGSHLAPDITGMTKADGNNVDIDLQMGKLAYNSSKYSLVANIMRKKFQLLNTAIKSN